MRDRPTRGPRGRGRDAHAHRFFFAASCAGGSAFVSLLAGATFSWLAFAGAGAVATRVDMAFAFTSRPPLATSEVSAPTRSIGAPRDERERARGPRRTRDETRGDTHAASSAFRDGAYRRAGVCDARRHADATLRTARAKAVEVPDTPLPINGHKGFSSRVAGVSGCDDDSARINPGSTSQVGNVCARATKIQGRTVRPTDAFFFVWEENPEK